MKQHITKKQWLELDEKTRFQLVKKHLPAMPQPNLKQNIKQWIDGMYIIVSIGFMIESLGVDWYLYLFEGDEGEMIVYKSYEGELCDALWEAVKKVLSKTYTQRP